MVRIAILGTLLLAILSPQLATAQESKFRPLFDGKTLHGWYGNNPHVTVRATAEQRAAAVEAQQAEFKAHWTVDNGELVNDGHGPYATTLEEFGDIELDHVITVCGHAHESCPAFPGKTKVTHVGFDDPPRLAKDAATEEEALAHYRRVRDEIRAFVETLPESLASSS